MTRTVWPSMSGGSGLESSSGKVGIWPVTKHQPSASTAWLKGATGVGAPGAMKKIGAAMSHAPAVDHEVLRRDQATVVGGEEQRHAGNVGRVDLLLQDL